MLAIVDRARQVRTRAISLLRLNIELAQLEMKRKARLFGIALVLGLVALVLALYGLGFAFAAIAAAIAEQLPLWASLLIVSGLLVVVALLFAAVAASVARKAGPVRPVETVKESQKTAEAVRRSG
jgi:uncharacterized membrane protein YqjE